MAQLQKQYDDKLAEMIMLKEKMDKLKMLGKDRKPEDEDSPSKRQKV